MWLSQILIALSSALVSATAPTSLATHDTIWMKCSGVLSLPNGSGPASFIYILDRDGNIYNYGREPYLNRMGTKPFDQTPNAEWSSHYFGISVSDNIATQRIEAMWRHNAEKRTFVQINVYDFKNLAYHHAITEYDWANADAKSPTSEKITEKWDWKCEKIAAMPFQGIREQP